MSWTYSQSTGKLHHNGQLKGTGYSGAGPTSAHGKNNPNLQGVVDKGPVPQGEWKIHPLFDHPTKGKKAMRLSPVNHNALGRTDFLIHGDSIANPGTASKGCIILPKEVRILIGNSGDHVLIVTP